MSSATYSWMGITMRSPLILASLSLFSKPHIEKHIDFFSLAANYGAGAVILPSINPSRETEKSGNPFVRTVTIPNGLNKENHLGFAVLGSTDEIVSVEYGLSLAKESQRINAPVIASVANIGDEITFLDVIEKIAKIPHISGIELNFSCPNVVGGLDISADVLHKARNRVLHLPISVKLKPGTSYEYLLAQNQMEHTFDSLTLFNAHKGLVPPTLDINNPSPFVNMKKWRPTGIYGPQEKLLTYYNIWLYKKCKAQVDLSSVGGFVSFEDIIGAIRLGADCVQLSSAVLWNGLRIFKEFNNKLESYLNENQISFDDLKGNALNNIIENDKCISENLVSSKMMVDLEKCKKCSYCHCIERGCYAISKDNTDNITINTSLCNVCNWCKNLCPFGAISNVDD
jgi:dihydroorotate dehydrogenase/Pyruvate/2-oxoacid:ferredoxin oxidoreductase delta subunit